MRQHLHTCEYVHVSPRPLAQFMTNISPIWVPLNYHISSAGERARTHINTRNVMYCILHFSCALVRYHLVPRLERRRPSLSQNCACCARYLFNNIVMCSAQNLIATVCEAANYAEHIYVNCAEARVRTSVSNDKCVSCQLHYVGTTHTHTRTRTVQILMRNCDTGRV